MHHSIGNMCIDDDDRPFLEVISLFEDSSLWFGCVAITAHGALNIIASFRDTSLMNR